MRVTESRQVCTRGSNRPIFSLHYSRLFSNDIGASLIANPYFVNTFSINIDPVSYTKGSCYSIFVSWIGNGHLPFEYQMSCKALVRMWGVMGVSVARSSASLWVRRPKTAVHLNQLRNTNGWSDQVNTWAKPQAFTWASGLAAITVPVIL